MINKFQQGGKQQDAVMQFVYGLAEVLQADPKQIIQVAQQNPDALKSAVQVYQETQDMQQAAQAFAQAFEQKTQAARHGAKLNYLKSLKNQCAEDEEVYYYKKGGAVECGCVKKEQQGGKTPQKNTKPIDKFKKDQQKKTEKLIHQNYQMVNILLIGLQKKEENGKDYMVIIQKEQVLLKIKVMEKINVEEL